jgi:hypothetical protein
MAGMKNNQVEDASLTHRAYSRLRSDLILPPSGRVAAQRREAAEGPAGEPGSGAEGAVTADGADAADATNAADADDAVH